MNPLLIEALGAIVRAGLLFVAGILVHHEIWTQAQADQYVGASWLWITLALLGLGLSFWQKFRMRSKLVTALAAARPMTEQAVTALVDTGNGAHVLTPKTETPQM